MTLLTPVHPENDSRVYFKILLTTDYCLRSWTCRIAAPYKFHVDWLKLRSHRTNRTELTWTWTYLNTNIQSTSDLVTPSVDWSRGQPMQYHVASTYFILIGCRHSELGRIVREPPLARCQISCWCLKPEFRSVYALRTRLKVTEWPMGGYDLTQIWIAITKKQRRNYRVVHGLG